MSHPFPHPSPTPACRRKRFGVVESSVSPAVISHSHEDKLWLDFYCPYFHQFEVWILFPSRASVVRSHEGSIWINDWPPLYQERDLLLVKSSQNEGCYRERKEKCSPEQGDRGTAYSITATITLLLPTGSHSFPSSQ